MDKSGSISEPRAGKHAEPEDQGKRVRQSADAFAFNALLNGVVRAPELEETEGASVAPGNVDAPLREVEHLTQGATSTAPALHRSAAPTSQSGVLIAAPPDRRWLWAILLVAALAGAVASLMVQVVLPRLKERTASKPPPITLNPLVLRGLPDAKLTPGDLGANSATITPQVRQTVLRAYGVGPEDRRFVLCPLIPKSLGGSNSSANLFPTTPWFANLKARLDRALTERVRAGRITTDQAIAELRGNWVKAAHSNYIRNYGQRDPAKARSAEDQLNW
ncbi:MAG: hypothetical protein ACO1SX_28640 [Actinomycetota bacterium]